MRIPDYLSPSSIGKFESDLTEFYLQYLADYRPPRMPQTQPMSIGSAFDARVKSYIYDKLYGDKSKEYAFETLFTKQVEEQNQEWARTASENAFQQYKDSGALADLMKELEKAVDDVKMELRISGKIMYSGTIGGIPLLGYPDIYFRLKDGTYAIFDWKVNGYCAKTPTSPAAGYINCRDGWKDSKPSRNSGMHKDCTIAAVGGILVNVANNIRSDWEQQLMIYGWLLGTPIGAKMIGGIEQLACKPGPDRVLVRIASHRSLISEKRQRETYDKICRIWEMIHSAEKDGDLVISYPHFFGTLPKDENDEICRGLDNRYKNVDFSDPTQLFLRNM